MVGAEKAWELGRGKVLGMVGSSEVIGDCESVKASSARTKHGWAAALDELAVAETRGDRGLWSQKAVGSSIPGFRRAF